MNHKNIYKQNGKYIIKKNIYCKSIYYGTFDNLTDAIEQRNILIKNNWHKNATTNYPKEQRFPKYQVKKTECGYLVLNKKTGRTFGTYKNYEYANIIKKILPFYGNEIDIRQIEKVAHKEFYKYISYNEMNGRYHIIYKGFVRSTHRLLEDALNERDLIIKYNGDEELMCEDPTIIHDYKKEKLPSFEHECENIRYRDENKNKYQLEKQIRNHKIVIGSYPTYDLACLIKRYLDSKKWKSDAVKHMIKTTRNIHKRDKYIHKRNGYFYIERKKGDDTIIYAKYSDIDLARHVKNYLAMNNWCKKFIKRYEKKYYLNKVETEYYYDSTDFFIGVT
jgi:hypothetical protein